MKTILVPTDFSVEAQKAYPLAASIANKYGVNLTLFHIVRSHIDDLVGHWSGTSLLYNPSSIPELDKGEQQDAELKLKQIAALECFKGIQVDTKISTSYDGNTLDSIINEINHENYGLIVMGTAGDEQEGESFAELVTRHTTIPIITTKRAIEDFTPKNIVVCTDFDTITMGFLQKIKSLKERYDAELTLLYVNTPQHFKTTLDAEKAGRRTARKYGLGDYKLASINANDVREGIEQYIERSGADMLALSTHGRTGLSHYFFGSNTEDLVNESEIPVYSYNLHEFLKNVRHEPIASARGFTG